MSSGESAMANGPRCGGALAGLLLTLGLMLGACQAPAFIAANVLPIKKIRAAYKPIDQKTVIFVDDPRRVVSSMQLLSVVAEKAARDLGGQKVITEFVPPAEINALRASASDFGAWPIDRVGRAVEAAQVIYILIQTFEPGGEGHERFEPIASARVRIVDVQTGRRLFPTHGEHGVTSRLYFRHEPSTGFSQGDQAAVKQKLAERIGADVARLFYDHKPREIGSGFED